MREYWCLTRYHFQVTASSHYLQVKNVQQFYMDILSKINLCITHTNLSKAKDLQNMVILYFPNKFLKIHIIQSALK